MKSDQDKTEKKPVAREILEWVLTIVAAVMIALPLRAFAFELVRVDGESMDDTLANGELMLVTKFDYATAWLTLPWQDNETREATDNHTEGEDA